MSSPDPAARSRSAPGDGGGKERGATGRTLRRLRYLPLPTVDTALRVGLLGKESLEGVSVLRRRRTRGVVPEGRYGDTQSDRPPSLGPRSVPRTSPGSWAP